MEQGRIILAIVLSFLVFLVWDYFFIEKLPPEQNLTEQKEPAPQLPVEDTPGTITAPPAATDETKPVASFAETSQADLNIKEVVVDTPLYQATLSEKGAIITAFVLKNYREEALADAPLKALIAPENKLGTLWAGLGELPGDSTNGHYQADTDLGTITIGEAAQTLTFTWRSDQNVLLEKQFTFQPDSYLIDYKVTVKNNGTVPFQDRVAVTLTQAGADAPRGYGFVGPSGYINGKLEQIKPKKIAETENLSGKIDWVAIQDRYFMKAVLPQTDQNSTLKLDVQGETVMTNTLLTEMETFNPGSEKSFAYQAYMGPKSLNILNKYNNSLAKSINFGMFDIIAKPCLWVMNFIYDNLIPNYGVAIILLTLLTKILLWPLGQKSYKSMNAMKKLQPLMAEIKEKYKDDKKLQNQETMALYRTYKVNPMGGCLPMVLQIPVFFALYRMLYEAIELRHAPFFGWITDLSAPDRLFNFGFSIPFMEPPYGIPVLTLIMGATMLLQQKMQPPMGDATQAKMMMLMPVVFTFIFINFSAGLVLYWLTNNVLSIGQQYYTQKKLA